MSEIKSMGKVRARKSYLSMIGVVALISLASFSFTAQAGKVTSVPSAFGAEGFGGWNLNNIEIIVNGTQSDFSGDGSWFNDFDGSYNFAEDTDFTYIGNIFDDVQVIMGYALAKDWPVGEPPGIKVINGDLAVKEPKPTNCIMATSYLADHFLDSAEPQQVTCSGPFQSHKRYKLAMLPTTVDSVGSESVDLVFNVEEEVGSRDYQVFQKINNWTGGRLQGFTIQVGFGVGSSFQTVEDAGVALADLHISVPSEIWSGGQLANFSAGLFGPLDKHTGNIGFFDPLQRAGFLIDEYVIGPQPLTDILHATRTLGSDYAEVPAGTATENQFGPWLPSNMLPYGIFFDDDGNPETDAELLAWYGYNPVISGLGWMGGSQNEFGPFATISAEEIEEMGENLAYTMGEIDDLVNVGLNYMVTVGDVGTFPSTFNDPANTTFTIRITPVADTSGTLAPSYVGIEPSPLLLFTSADAEVLLEPNVTFVIGSLLTARVGDADLNLDPIAAEEVVIDISTDSGLNGTLTLIEQGENRGVFAAILPEEFSNVVAGTVVTMSYVDESVLVGDKTKISSSMAIFEPAPILSDVSITDFSVPDVLFDGLSRTLKLVIANDRNAEEFATGSVLITGSDGSEFLDLFTNLEPGRRMKISHRWTAGLADSTVADTVNWDVSVLIDDEIVDTTSAVTIVDVKVGKNSRR